MKIQIHSMELLLVSNNAKIRALQVEESKEHDQSSLHHAQYDQHGVYIPMTKISAMCLLISTKLVSYRKLVNYFWIIWWVKLYDPINSWNIQTSSSNIGAQKCTRFSVTKLEKCCCALGLLLLTL